MERLRSPVVRAGIVALEILGVVLAVAAGATAFVFWRVQSGPISLNFFRPSAEFAIERALPPGHDARIGAARLREGGAKGEIDLILESVSVADAAGATTGDLSRVEFTFSFGDLMRGAFGPRTILAVDPVLRIARDMDRKFKLDIAPNTVDRKLFHTLTGIRLFRGAFQRAELQGARVYFEDVASGRVWRADGAEANIRRTDEGYAARLNGVFDIDGKPASMMIDAAYSRAEAIIAADVEVIDAPVGDLLDTFLGAGAAVISAPVTGEASVRLTRSGEVVSAYLTGETGAGTIKIGDRTFDLAALDLATTFDPDTNKFGLQRFHFDVGGSSGDIQGGFGVQFTENAFRPAAIDFSLTGANLIIDTQGELETPLPIASLTAKGGYDLSARRISIDALTAQFLDVALTGEGAYAPPVRHNDTGPRWPEFRADFTIDGALDPARILSIWPQNRGLGARDFVVERLPRASIENVAFRLDLDGGPRDVAAPFPDDALSLTFDIKNATTYYSPRMTPLTGASGKAHLSGNHFIVRGARGRVGKVAMSDGEIDFTALSPKGQPVNFRFTASGDAREMLTVLDEQPLAVLRSTSLSPSQFSGTGKARVLITRPNLREAAREDYGYSGTATFEDLTIMEFYNGIDLADAAGSIDLATRQMTLKADAALGGAPINLEWTQRFYADEGPSSFRLTGEVNSSTGDVFGIQTRQFLRGPVSFEATANGDLGAISDIKLTADFTRAAITSEALGWRKPQGVQTAGALAMSFADDGMMIDNIALEGDGVEIRGAASLGESGVLDAATFERFYLKDAADFSLTASRTDTGLLDIAATGAYLDAGRLVENAIDAGGAGEDRNSFETGEGMNFRVRLDKLTLRRGEDFRDASLDFRRNEERILDLDFSALTSYGGAPLSMTLRPTGAETGPTQVVEARTDDIGALLAGVFGVSSIKGGEGSMEILVEPRREQRARGFSGVLEARRMQLVRAPLFARIFSAGSLDGLGDLLRGEGISLNRAYARFDYENGLLTVDEARATGPSVGITGAGTVSLGESGAVSLNGAVAPAYQVNSLLGKTPLIGDIFVSREGEGVVALSYNVTGTSAAPAVTVNPLSALTPGFLRRMFEFDLTPDNDAPPVAPPPNANGAASEGENQP